MRFLGFDVDQNFKAIKAFSLFLDIERFDSIIEIGTYRGGFTGVLAVICANNHYNLITIDIKNYINEMVRDILIKLDVRIVLMDIFSANAEVFIEEIIKQGRTLLLCDNGEKLKEFAVFAPFIKKNDVIMCHDYYRDYNEFSAIKDYEKIHLHKGIPIPCQEDYNSIAQVCNKENLSEYYLELFANTGWGSFIKK